MGVALTVRYYFWCGNPCRVELPLSTRLFGWYSFNFLSNYLISVLAALGLGCCAGAFSSCDRWGLLCSCGAQAFHCDDFLCCRTWALGTRASVVSACRLSSCGSRAREHLLSSWGAEAYLLCSMWNPPGAGIEPMSLALVGRLLTTDHQESP